MGSIGLDQYLRARDAALGALQSTMHIVEGNAAAALDVRTAGFRLSERARAALSEAAGHTLDARAESHVGSALSDLLHRTSVLSERAGNDAAAARSARPAFDAQLWWPPAAQSTEALPLAHLDLSDWNGAVAELNRALNELSSARQAWQAEQDRIAAEQRAAELARESASPRSSGRISGAGGEGVRLPESSTPADSSASSLDQIAAELLGYEARLSVNWSTGACNPGIICGITSLGNAQPVVTLDPNVGSAYLSYAGTYVLVHEAAHARSWYRYGSYAALEAASTSLMTNGFSGKPAVEWMADCATIVRIGYSMGTYTSSCTADQLAEAATYWN